MYGEVWYDVIVLQHGSRDIEFSSKLEKEATSKMEKLFKDGHITYVVKNTVQNNGVVKKHLLDPYKNYVPYEVKDDE